MSVLYAQGWVKLKHWLSRVLLSVSCLMLGACSTGAYLWQASAGHLKILAGAEPISELLNKPDLPEELRTQLEYVQRIRAFSIDTLALPDNRSYRKYAELNRPYVVWNVVGAPVDSLVLENWCFPFTGCISYKGFYAEKDALELAEQLRLRGLDVAVLGVPAYSTLGFTPDPVLSTFIRYPAGELARLIFHELAHQVIYIADDTAFNESFATAVEELGVQAWLGLVGQEELLAQYQTFDSRRTAFRALLAGAQRDLRTLYAQADLNREQVLDRKQARFEQLRSDYEQLKAQWGGWSGYDRFMNTDLNNAKLAVSGLYTDHVSAFKVLFARCASDFPRFYAAVERLGELDAQRRVAILDALKSRQFIDTDLGCSMG